MSRTIHNVRKLNGQIIYHHTVLQQSKNIQGYMCGDQKRLLHAFLKRLNIYQAVVVDAKNCTIIYSEEKIAPIFSEDVLEICEGAFVDILRVYEVRGGFERFIKMMK